MKVETCYPVCFHTVMGKRISSNKQNSPTDEELVAETLAGNRRSYQQLVQRYQDRLFVIAYDILKNREDAEDVVQESFVKAFFSLSKFKGESSIFSWLYRITFNMALDLKRKLKRRGGYHFEYTEQRDVSSGNGDERSWRTPSIDLATGGPAIGSGRMEDPFEALNRKETGTKIEKVISELSEEHRAVITLREVDGLDYDEIATRLGVPRGTVMSRLFYARKALQKALSDFTPEGREEVS